MSFMKEFSQYLLKYGEIAITKTEFLTKIAKVKIEIKKLEGEIEKVKIEIGDYTINQFEHNEHVSEDVIKFKIDKISKHLKGIDELKNRLETIKAQMKDGGTGIS